METLILKFLNKIESELYLLCDEYVDDLIIVIREFLYSYMEVLRTKPNLIFERTSHQILMMINSYIKGYILKTLSDKKISVLNIQVTIQNLFIIYSKFFNNVKKEMLNENMSNIIYIDKDNDFDYIKYYELFFYYVN